MFIVCLAMVLVVRIWLLQDMSEAVLNCRWCVTPSIIRADVPYLSLLAVLFAISTLRASWWWRLLWRLPAIVGVWVYAADVATMVQFGTRLMIADVRIYLVDSALAMSVLQQASVALIVSIVLLLAISVWWLLVKQRTGGRRFWIGVCATGLLGGGLPWLLPVSGYVHQWALENVLVANRPTGVATPYSEATRQRLASGAIRPFYCSMQPAQRDNVVVLVLESWSPYHSKRWLGVNDWTPRLDALAGEGIWFSRLHAGGFNTNEGLVSLLTGRQILLPFVPSSQLTAFEGAWQDPHAALPYKLQTQGYHTAFLTSGDLSYTRKGEWLSHIGFNELHGHDVAAYDGLPRLHFNAVEDKMLYAHALSFIGRQQRLEAPQFVVVENVSTHHPFIHPRTQARSEEQVFRYMDETAADFIEGLKRQDFFANGLLVVVSDHRAMTIVSREEQALLGTASASRIPGFIITGEREVGEVDLLYHQADLMSTLMAHVSEPHFCQSRPLRSLLQPDISWPDCVFHARGDQRDRVNVFCDHGSGTIVIAGDDSRFLKTTGLSEMREQHLLERLAQERQ